MKEPYLEVTYRHGRPLAAYYYLPRDADAQPVRPSRARPGLIVDYSAAGTPIGIEITAPSQITLEAFNALLSELNMSALGKADFAPLHAA